ncbi:hypothetical protein ACFLYD_04485 [Chloroflexota bacterium]
MINRDGNGANDSELPDPSKMAWTEFWRRIPERWRSPVLLAVAGAIIVGFLVTTATGLCNLTAGLKEIVATPIPPAPTRFAHLLKVNADPGHAVIWYESISGCIDGAFLLPKQDLGDVLDYLGAASSSSFGAYDDDDYENRRAELRRRGIPLAPLQLDFHVIQEKRSEYDQILVTGMNLHLDGFSPWTTPTGIIVNGTVCADGRPDDPSSLPHLLVEPAQSTYDVLKPRASAPPASSFVITEPFDIFELNLNALQSGVYTMSLTMDYIMEGQPMVSNPLVFTMAVPDEIMIETVHSTFIYSDTEEIVPPSLFLDEYWRAQGTYIRVGFEHLQTAPDGPSGHYTSLVNMGKDVDLTDWMLVGENDRVYFAFPHFTLKSGHGVRVWSRKGTNTGRDLFGAQVNATEDPDQEPFVQLLDRFNQPVADSWYYDEYGR